MASAGLSLGISGWRGDQVPMGGIIKRSVGLFDHPVCLGPLDPRHFGCPGLGLKKPRGEKMKKNRYIGQYCGFPVGTFLSAHSHQLLDSADCGCLPISS